MKEKVCHYLSGDTGAGVIMKKVTNGDIGGRKSKIWHFRGDIIFEWPLRHIHMGPLTYVISKVVSNLMADLNVDFAVY